jgi:hypothetical protein
MFIKYIEILRNFLPLLWMYNMFNATYGLKTAKGSLKIWYIIVIISSFLWAILESLNNFIN